MLVLLIILIPLLLLLAGWIFQLLWNNAVVEAVTVCQPVDFWTAFMLMIFMSAFLASKGYSKS